MHGSRKAIGLLGASLLVAVISVATPASAAVSCTTINKYYPFGVSASKYSKNIGNELASAPRVRSSVYKKYSHLDTDRDRIVCEVELETLSVAERAYRDVSGLIDGSYIAGDDHIISSKAINSTYKEVLRERLSTAFSMWDELMPVNKDYKAVFFTMRDFDWAQEQTRIRGGQAPTGSWRSQALSLGLSEEVCGLGMAVGNHTFYNCVGTSMSRQLFLDGTVGHEYFHSVQYHIGLDHTTPVWIAEGSATYMGIVSTQYGANTMNQVASNSGSEFLTNRYGVGGMKNYIKRFSDADIQNLYGALEVGASTDSIAPMSKYNGYFFGGLAVQKLIGDHGYDTFMSFLKDIGQGTPWKQSFIQKFKMSPSAFYSDMLSYLNTVY
jgi:hypothetical protein